MMFYDVLIATRLRFDKQSLPVVGPLPQSASVCLSLPQSASVCLSLPQWPSRTELPSAKAVC